MSGWDRINRALLATEPEPSPIRRVIETLIKEFDNPDNNPHQRSAIEEAKDLLANLDND